MTRETWLNGWRRTGRTVLVGNGIRCAGCGKSRGVATVLFDPDATHPDRDPVWPFDQEDCPICAEHRDPPTDPTRLPQ